MNNLKKTIITAVLLIIFGSNALFGMQEYFDCDTDADKELLDAIQNKKKADASTVLKTIKALNKGANINMYSLKTGNTLLIYPIQHDDFLLFLHLLNNKIDINKQNKENKTAAHMLFYYKVSGGRTQYLKKLYEYGAKFDITDYKGRIPLHSAVITQDIEAIQYLLSIGADHHAKDNNKKSPLDYANESNNEKVINLFTSLDSGKKYKEQHKEEIIDEKALETTTSIYNNATDKKDFEKIAVVKKEQCINWDAELFRSVENNDRDGVQHALDKNANINMEYNKYRNLLQCVFNKQENSEDSYLDIFSLLLVNKINVNLSDEMGNSYHWLLLSYIENKLPYLEELYKNNANIHLKNGLGHTPLHMAVRAQNVEAVKFFIKKGSKINVARHDGTTILDSAAKLTDNTILKLLNEKLEQDKKENKQKLTINNIQRQAGPSTSLQNVWNAIKNNNYAKEIIFKVERTEERQQHYLTTDTHTLQTLGYYTDKNNKEIKYYIVDHSPLNLENFGETVYISQQGYKKRKKKIDNLFDDKNNYQRFFVLSDSNKSFKDIQYMKNKVVFLPNQTILDSLIYNDDPNQGRQESITTQYPFSFNDIQNDYKTQQDLFEKLHKREKEKAKEQERMKEFTTPEYFNINFIYLNRLNW